MTYEDAQDATSDRFADVAKLAKLRQRDLDLTDDRETLTFAARNNAAGLARDQLVSSGFELLSLEVQKRNYADERSLDPDLQLHCDRVGRLLDIYVGSGSAKVAERRAFLREIGPYATAGRNDELDYNEAAGNLKRLKVSREYGDPVELRTLDGKERRMTRHTNSSVLGRGTTVSDEQLQSASAALRDFCEELTKRVREKDYFRDPGGRDDVGSRRNPQDVAHAIEQTNAVLNDGIARISDPWQQDPLKHVAEEAQRRQAEIEAVNARDSFFSDEFSSTRSVSPDPPRPVGLKRPSAAGSSPEARPAVRRRIEIGHDHDGGEGNDANAHATGVGHREEPFRGSSPIGPKVEEAGIKSEYHNDGGGRRVGSQTPAHSENAPALDISTERDTSKSRSYDPRRSDGHEL